jgi:exosortase/archaeosortase family protein
MVDRDAQENQPRSRKEAVRFIVFFFLLVLGFTFLVRLPLIDEGLILPYTKFITWISSKSFLLAGIEVEAISTYMRHPSFSVDIRRGCDGVVATLILVSACIAFPAPWWKKIRGVLWGYVLIFVLNLVRVVVLFSLGMKGWMEAFEFVHTYIAQFVVIAAAMIFWVYWASRLDNPGIAEAQEKLTS